MFFEYDNLNAGLSQCVTKSTEWLNSHPSVKDKLADYLSGFEELQFVVPLELEVGEGPGLGGHPFPFIPPWLHVFYEADQELDSIITTCLCGLYKDSLRAIRSLLELNLLGLHFFAERDYERFKSWLDGRSETPQRRRLVSSLIRNSENIRKLDRLLWQEQVARSYRELSGFTHTSGKKGSFSALRPSNMTIFSEGAVAYTVECLLRVIKVAAMGRIAIFPMALQPVDVVRKFGFNGPVMGWLDEDQVDRIGKLFTPEETQVLRQISADDADAACRMQAVAQRKNLTDEELTRDLQEYIDRLKGEDRASFLRLTKGSSMARVVALVTARNKAFMRCAIPVLNEHFLGLIDLSSQADQGP